MLSAKLAYNIIMFEAFNTPQKITLCATNRLSHGLLAHAQAVLVQSNIAHITQNNAQNNSVWRTPTICTLQQWLATFCEQALLLGEISANNLPQLTLSNMTEKMLWQQAIQQSLQKNELAALFDIASLAESAMEANQLLIDWQVTDAQLNQHYQSSETWQFLRWRAQFQALCAKNNALEAARVLLVQVVIIKNTQLPLPTEIEWLGFDRITPLLQSLMDALQVAGVRITISQPSQHANAQQMAFADVNTECRAAVAWAKQQLTLNPQANLAIITPILGNIRSQLANLLDDTFHPETLNPSHFELPRVYDFSIGLPLSEHVMVSAALKILRLVCTQRHVAQADFSALLLDVAWGSADEIDLRSQLDANMRKHCPRHLSLRAMVSLSTKYAPQSQLFNHLQALQTTQQAWRDKPKQMASIWASQFAMLLESVNWANTRSFSSFEYQAHSTWLEILQSMSKLDVLLGRVSASEALYQLTQLCANHMFLPQTKNQPNIQILGMLESSAVPLDGAWVLGLNDANWPPPARPNPLLPITLQRELNMPNANADIQAAFAQKIQQRLMHCADNVVFSWAHKESDRELRPSPVLSEIAFATKMITPINTMAENLAKPMLLDLIDDNIAPPVSEAEQIRGGSQLFAAQAVCPAWAFYQYRLGATALESPTDGLDSMARGNLVHAALQHFWLICKDLSTLKLLKTDALHANIHAACEAALKQLEAEQLPIRIIEIERLRLQQLLQSWLALECERDDFTVQHCEYDVNLAIEGLTLKLRIDRIDVLPDGGLVIIDYKTGATTQSHTSWADARIKTPQLPLYAALVLKESQVVATCFAKVHVHECTLTGMADRNLLQVTSFEKLASNSAFKKFADMPALIAHWQQSLTTIAQEIKNGVADVRFDKEADLLYCDVKPLLRLPERELQFEQQQTSQQLN